MLLHRCLARTRANRTRSGATRTRRRSANSVRTTRRLEAAFEIKHIQIERKVFLATALPQEESEEVPQSRFGKYVAKTIGVRVPRSSDSAELVVTCEVVPSESLSDRYPALDLTIICGLCFVHIFGRFGRYAVCGSRPVRRSDRLVLLPAGDASPFLRDLIDGLGGTTIIRFLMELRTT